MEFGELLEWMLYKENTFTSTLEFDDEKELLDRITTLMDMPEDENRKLSTGDINIMTFIEEHADELDVYPVSYEEFPWLYSAYELTIAFGGEHTTRQNQKRDALATQLGKWELIVNATDPKHDDPAMRILLTHLAEFSLKY